MTITVKFDNISKSFDLIFSQNDKIIKSISFPTKQKLDQFLRQNKVTVSPRTK